MKKRFVLFTFIYIITFLIFSFVNTSFDSNYGWVELQSLILTTAFNISIFWSQTRKYILLSSIPLILLMIGFFTFNLIDLANMMGSTAIGLITVNLLSYLPQLVKLGYIKEL